MDTSRSHQLHWVTGTLSNCQNMPHVGDKIPPLLPDSDNGTGTSQRVLRNQSKWIKFSLMANVYLLLLMPRPFLSQQGDAHLQGDLSSMSTPPLLRGVEAAWFIAADQGAAGLLPASLHTFVLCLVWQRLDRVTDTHRPHPDKDLPGPLRGELAN